MGLATKIPQPLQVNGSVDTIASKIDGDHKTMEQQLLAFKPRANEVLRLL